MKRAETVADILTKAKEQGCTKVEIDGVVYHLSGDKDVPSPSLPVESSHALQTPFDDFTDEEILFLATPYFDTLQEKKRLHAEALKERENGN